MQPTTREPLNHPEPSQRLMGEHRCTHHGDLRDVPVATVMSRPVLAVSVSAPFDEALRTLVARGVRHLAVVDGAGRCVGLLADRTVAAEWVGRPIAFGLHTVAEACTDLQPIIDDDATVGVAVRAMRRCGTDAVVVVDRDRRPLGVLTGGDLIALLAKPDPERNMHDV